ncbi:sister chromatid cohesion protein PDS5 homolog C-like [Andrographis paniculata]|uniref:sister chromatid cohesion protein PDS5 homolog C-like n=1 Tax=Andrographis paniculata TaxID=175694 RepID=UPI0021E901B9|nr:sister chromatid cohesion protein PDS5 homolog C-like [Andrographis paniculata]
MPPRPGKLLEERLAAAGCILIQPPPSTVELLTLLGQIEVLLSKVEQSPAKTMRDALSRLINALAAEKLLKHSHGDVKVSVALCISEITRITAPEAPYDDDKLKDVMQLIVSSFEHLSDTSTRSRKKRITILKIMAKVRSWVVMLDFGFDQIIIEMFQYFLKGITDYHTEDIFSYMETIMSRVLLESEDISSDLLGPILVTLKKNNKAVFPAAKKLAVTVIQITADKIRPYLTQAIKSLDAFVCDFDEVVSSICREDIGLYKHDSLHGIHQLETMKSLNAARGSGTLEETGRVNSKRKQVPDTSEVLERQQSRPKFLNGAGEAEQAIVELSQPEPISQHNLVDVVPSKPSSQRYQATEEPRKSKSMSEATDVAAEDPSGHLMMRNSRQICETTVGQSTPMKTTPATTAVTTAWDVEEELAAAERALKEQEAALSAKKAALEKLKEKARIRKERLHKLTELLKRWCAARRIQKHARQMIQFRMKWTEVVSALVDTRITYWDLRRGLRHRSPDRLFVPEIQVEHFVGDQNVCSTGPRQRPEVPESILSKAVKLEEDAVQDGPSQTFEESGPQPSCPIDLTSGSAILQRLDQLEAQAATLQNGLADLRGEVHTGISHLGAGMDDLRAQLNSIMDVVSQISGHFAK